MRLGAGFDPAVSLNACALVIVGETQPMTWRPIVIKTWQGSSREPLDIRLNVGPEAAEIVKASGLRSWRSDLFARADVHHVSRDAALSVSFDEESVLDSFGTTRILLHRHLSDQPGERLVLRADDPELDEQCGLLAKELTTVLLRRTRGTAEIILPTIGGQHGDRARALVRALRHAGANAATDLTDYSADNDGIPSWGADANDTREEFA